MRLLTGLVVLAAVPALALPSAALAAHDGPPTDTDLTGAAEVPGPGDPDASGFASLSLRGSGTICYDVSWADVDGAVVAGHIHVGSADVAGPVVVPLPGVSGEGTGGVSDCTTADPDLVKAIRRDPSSYYVNVHSTVFPAGAIRGQLGH